jgi:hypothetical protein
MLWPVLAGTLYQCNSPASHLTAAAASVTTAAVNAFTPWTTKTGTYSLTKVCFAASTGSAVTTAKQLLQHPAEN